MDRPGQGMWSDFMTLVRFAVICFVALAAMAGAAFAAGDDVFVVPRVAVQAQADSATAAKLSAQRLGRRRAMELLLRRLTIEDDWPHLPRVGSTDDPALAAAAADAGYNVVTLTDGMLENLESGFEVYNEKTSATTYRAYITYRFKPSAIRKLLRDSKIPYSEAQTRTALVIPVLQTSNGVYLWEENNPWMAAWKARPFNNELTPMTAPLGDLEDSATISGRQALAVDGTALAAMAQRYSVSQVIVAHAYLREEAGEHKLRVRLVNGYRETGDLLSEEELVQRVSADGYGGPELSAGPAINAFTQPKVGDVLAESWFSRPVGNFPALAEEAIETVLAKHAKPWKESTLIDHTEAALLEASAYFNSIGEWAKIRSALVSTPLVGSVQVRSLSRRGAEMLVRAYGDPQKLVVAMEAYGLALWSDDGEFWYIATPATANAVRLRGDNRRRRRLGEAEGAGDGAIQPAAYEDSADADYGAN